MEVRLRAECIILFLTQIAASHVFWLGLAEDAQHGWCDVAKSTARLQAQVIVVGDENEWNGISGVIRVRAAGLGIDHSFGVAVVGGDDPGTAARLKSLVNT